MADASRMTASKWVVVLCYAQAEWQAHTGLLARGIRSFLPYTLGSSRRGRWCHGIVRPQYPGYLFVALEDGATVEKIRRTAGVYEFLRANGNLVFLSHHQIASLKKRWLADYRAAAPRLIRDIVLTPGEWVAVPHGPFAGVPCQITALDKSGAICASIGQLQVTFHRTDISAQSVRARAKPAKNHATSPQRRR